MISPYLLKPLRGLDQAKADLASRQQSSKKSQRPLVPADPARLERASSGVRLPIARVLQLLDSKAA